MKGKKERKGALKSDNPTTLHDVNKARERQEFIDAEKGPENKGKKYTD
jgi:hypothetical protein